MRVLVIGGTGFIGKHVVEKLVASGNSLAVLHRGAPSLAWPIQEISADRDDPGDLKTAIQSFRPDLVLDMILYTEPQARSLAEAARGMTGRLVIVSSADVYRNYDGLRGKSASPPDPIPLSEAAPLRETRFPYRGEGLTFDHAEDYDKIPVEQAVSGMRDLPATILRLPAVYGPGDESHRLRPYLKRMASQRPFLLLSEEQSRWLWTRGYVENVAAAIALAVTDSRAAGRVYNVGEEPTLSEADWVAAIARVVGWRGEIVTMPAAELPESVRSPYDWRYHLSTDTGRIRKEIGYAEPVPEEEALRRSVGGEWASLSEAPEPDYRSEEEAVRSYSIRTTRRTTGSSGPPDAARTK